MPDETPCLSDDLLGLLRAGHEGGPDVSAAREHVLSCLTCATRLTGGFAAPSAPPEATTTQGAPVRYGPYEVVAPLGRGGQAEVFEAVDTRSGAAVAVKVFLEESQSARGAMHREFASGRAVRHPSVIEMLDWISGERDALVTELVVGRPLTELIASRELSPHDVDRIARGTLEGLAALHTSELLHRDLKPSNVLIRAVDGAPILIDLGLAKSTATDTTTRAHVGTPVYWPPEVASGRGWTSAGDVYAYGRVVLSMLESLPEQKREASWTPFIKKCLSPFAEERFANATDALRAYPKKPKAHRRWPALAGALAAVFVVVGGFVLASLFSSKAPAPAPHAPALSAVPRPTPFEAQAAPALPTDDLSMPRATSPGKPEDAERAKRQGAPVARRARTAKVQPLPPHNTDDDVVITPAQATSFVTD